MIDTRVRLLTRSILADMRGHQYTGHTGEGGSLYCSHGTYLGTWWGADYLCGACEDGIGDLEYAYYQAKSIIAREDRERDIQFRNDMITAICHVGAGHPFLRVMIYDFLSEV